MGTADGRFADAALRRGEGAVEEVGEGGPVGGWDCMPRRWIASLEAFSRMYARWASVSPGRDSEMSMRRTLVGEPWVEVRWYGEGEDVDEDSGM